MARPHSAPVRVHATSLNDGELQYGRLRSLFPAGDRLRACSAPQVARDRVDQGG
eukprot:CAMPEP_0172032046 /NCGR_PEP_ID=MMETSP1041-20130122/19651_1 /TAXON_ID=464988 /ORGANISM="Hemiselmis andersenii, Strain CCMP439" /LENGTH=53 /DNA_ID=CAMNT_0012688641 /DNA_START=65 /DNA_END=223 /DNA_ORIENTATION=+